MSLNSIVMKKTKPSKWKYEDNQDETGTKNFRPTPKHLSFQTVQRLCLLYCVLMSISLIVAVVILLGTEQIPFSKEKWWPYVSYAAMITPILVVFFDTALICFPQNDMSYQILAQTLKAYGKMKSTKYICCGLLLCLIICGVDYCMTFGINQNTIAAAVGAVIIAWFSTGVIRFIRFY